MLQINKLQDDKAPVRQELGERIREISQLRTELECVKKDKGITAGLITQMQRDMSNKVCFNYGLFSSIESNCSYK